MSAITPNGTPSVSSLGMVPQLRLAGLPVGEDLTPGAACVITSSGGQPVVMLARASTGGIIHGYQLGENAYYAQGGTASLGWEDRWQYGTSLVPGSNVYLSATVAGALDTEANNSNIGLASATVSGGSGGTGYAVGDIIIQTGGTFIRPAVWKVATVSTGVIATVSLVDAGIYIAAPSGANAVTGGTGSGATLVCTAATLLLPAKPCGYVVDTTRIQLNRVTY
jgi:hypothetical protein